MPIAGLFHGTQTHTQGQIRSHISIWFLYAGDEQKKLNVEECDRLTRATKTHRFMRALVCVCLMCNFFLFSFSRLPLPFFRAKKERIKFLIQAIVFNSRLYAFIEWMIVCSGRGARARVYMCGHFYTPFLIRIYNNSVDNYIWSGPNILAKRNICCILFFFPKLFFPSSLALFDYALWRSAGFREGISGRSRGKTSADKVVR